jgi:3-hydroxyisobutyrate dehydrogenase-like beta-hydroxyacid dehydrogenase
MAARLLGAGHALVVCDPDPDAISAARDAGATVVDTPREVADAAPVVMVSLPRPGWPTARPSRSMSTSPRRAWPRRRR